MLLTISSPLTIIFWTSLFTSKALEKGYEKRELIPFGLAAGLATAVFLGFMVTGASFLRLAISGNLIRFLNTAVGLLLSFYALIRLVRALKLNPKKIMND